MPGDHSVINVLIVDDEKEACANLAAILTEYVAGGINILGKAHSARDAEKQINKLRPDALFLDIEMPNENAFHFLERISPVNFEVIFVTAYDEYAIKAFRLNAVDYILKPLSIPELTGAVAKLSEKIKLKKLLSDNGANYTELSNIISNKVRSHRITLKDNNTIEVVDFKDIYFIEAQGSYIRIVFLKNDTIKEIVLSGTLTDYEELMPVESFFRIHKSYLVNCLHAGNILKDDVARLIINGKFHLPISRRRYTPLLEFLNKHGYSHE
jgi:two-component system, LytTR family, response regulator